MLPSTYVLSHRRTSYTTMQGRLSPRYLRLRLWGASLWVVAALATLILTGSMALVMLPSVRASSYRISLTVGSSSFLLGTQPSVQATASTAIVLPTKAAASQSSFHASQALVRINQLDAAQYDSAGQFTTWSPSACSAASMTEVLNAYGNRYRLTDVLAVEAELGEITPELGMLNGVQSIRRTVARFGFQATDFSIAAEAVSVASIVHISQIANAGTPVIVAFPPSRWSGGHLLVVKGGTSQSVLLADSSSYDMYTMSLPTFLKYWAGFAVVVTPLLPTMPAAMPHSPYVQLAWKDAVQVGIRPDLFVQQMNQESGFNPHALSPAGAEGIAQFMPATAAGLHIDPWNPAQALQGAAMLMSEELHTYHGNIDRALAAYNAGGAAVNAALVAHGFAWLASMPQETQHYVVDIVG